MDRIKLQNKRRLAVFGSFLGCALLPLFIYLAEQADNRLPPAELPVVWLLAIIGVLVLLVYTHIIAYG